MGTVEGRGIMVDVDVAVIMRDGAVLRADVHRPAAGGPFPALVHRSAYGKQNAPMVSGLVADPKVLAAAGFAVVVQDVRGRFASEGEWAPFVHEMDDGYDTVEWAASQPWCTGEVGCYGSSYMGITTHLAVAAKPPHLRAAAVLVASRDPNDGLLRTGRSAITDHGSLAASAAQEARSAASVGSRSRRETVSAALFRAQRVRNPCSKAPPVRSNPSLGSRLATSTAAARRCGGLAATARWVVIPMYDEP
jgi:putative CocE/NonD family hydrolase